MVRYFDSIIMLAGILGQKPSGLIASLWDPAEIRLSSTLAKIECLIGIRRAGTLQKLAPGGPWCMERIHSAPWCTACSKELCHSFRRDGAAAGRMLTVAMLS